MRAREATTVAHRAFRRRTPYIVTLATVASGCSARPSGGGFDRGAKAAKKLRMEGEDYVMQDGDMVKFRFNV